MNKVSAILITREEKYPEIILERIDQGFDFFEEILVLPECPSIYHRYLAIEKAKCDHIFVADDDVLLNYAHLYSFYDGKRITNGMPKDFIKKYEDMQCTLVGWGTFFPKSMLSCFDKYVKKFGVDSHLLREADRILTAMNKPWNTICMPHEDLQSSKSPDRMSYEEDHYKSAQEAIVKALSLS